MSSPTISVWWPTLIFTNKFLWIKNNEVRKETKTVKAIPKIDKILNKIFVKIDKRWEVKAKLIYKKVIKKIDYLISKSKNEKKKKLLEYIKIKFEEKVK